MRIIQYIKSLLAEAFEFDNPEDCATVQFSPSNGWQAIFETNGGYTSFPVLGFEVVYVEGVAVEASGMVFQEPPLLFAADAHPELEYSIDQPGTAPVVPCDRRLLNQALTNLLQNAADAIAMRGAAEAMGAPERPPGETVGHITVRVSQGEDAVEVAVEDDGVGLPEGDERDRLAEPYVTHKAKGTGLGLAIVKKIMEDHGGKLRLEDPPQGCGARAVLTLPWRPASDRGGDGGPAAEGQHGIAAEAGTTDGIMRRAHGA